MLSYNPGFILNPIMLIFYIILLDALIIVIVYAKDPLICWVFVVFSDVGWSTACLQDFLLGAFFISDDQLILHPFVKKEINNLCLACGASLGSL